jgi:hypothetical protein
MLNIDGIQGRDVFPQNMHLQIQQLSYEAETVNLTMRDKQLVLFNRYSLTHSLILMLLSSGYIKESPLAVGGAPKYTLSNIGFHYVLLDTPTQVHAILTKYIDFVQKN